MNEEIKELIQKTVEETLAKGGFSVRTEISLIPSSEEESAEGIKENIVCNILTDNDSSFLIGQYGVNLQALQHLIRLMIRKQTEEKLKFTLDVNSYRQQKNQTLVDQAHLAAEQAIEEGRAVVLRPMSAYERRIIHLELSKNDLIRTESIGDGEDRRVVVKPVGSLSN
jgi:spoIIIJ-associated protein